jgi:hypothetical protein
MAGGWGYTVQAPMEVPQEPPYRYLDDDMPEVQSPSDLPLPDAPNVDTSRLRILNKAMPRKPGGEIQERGRMEAAAEYAGAMGEAYAITKAYNKAYARRAKAKGRAMERAAQHRPNQATNAGKKYDNRNDAYSRYSTFRAAQAFGHHPHDGMY